MLASEHKPHYFDQTPGDGKYKTCVTSRGSEGKKILPILCGTIDNYTFLIQTELQYLTFDMDIG